jgi:hypothetical protein
VAEMKDLTLVADVLTVRGAMKQDDVAALKSLADKL